MRCNMANLDKACVAWKRCVLTKAVRASSIQHVVSRKQKNITHNSYGKYNFTNRSKLSNSTKRNRFVFTFAVKE